MCERCLWLDSNSAGITQFLSVIFVGLGNELVRNVKGFRSASMSLDNSQESVPNKSWMNITQGHECSVFWKMADNMHQAAGRKETWLFMREKQHEAVVHCVLLYGWSLATSPLPISVTLFNWSSAFLIQLPNLVRISLKQRQVSSSELCDW